EEDPGGGGGGGALARRLAAELTTPDAAGPVAVEGLALELVAELARGRVMAATRHPPKWLLEAEELVRAQFRTPTSVGAIARTIRIDPATLARAYRRQYRCTVGERIRMLRVDHAARELLETDDPLSTIALAAGFYDQSHFTNVFRRQLGITPAAYREEHGR
ncbi:MAG: helix-turn-helix transcriptional regulator, partial [Gemmatimonadota bacterium]|nr:helix-turn-helix transcriptional regulator [Gemmatimonadota bacterium]